MTQKAKVFANGRSQAVRLPAEFRVKQQELYIRRDEETGDLILSSRPNNWDRLEKLLNGAPDPNGEDFLDDRLTEPAPERDLF